MKVGLTTTAATGTTFRLPCVSAPLRETFPLLPASMPTPPRPHPVTASLRRSILDHAVHPSLAAQFDVQLLTRGDALQESPLGIGAERPAFNQEP